VNRRSFLLALSASTFAFLAGCKGGSEPAPAAGNEPHACACAAGAEGGCGCAECKAGNTAACTCDAPPPK
jgi:hypothetical protein